jgi:beta-N-acetylhexosaminidase
VEAGRIEHATIDRAVERILRAKKGLGLFDGPAMREEIPSPQGERRALSRGIARSAVTRVRHRNGLLPLAMPGNGRLLILEPEHPHHPLEWGLHFRIHGLAEFARNHHDRIEHALFGAVPETQDVARICNAAEEADAVLISTFFRSRAGQTGLLTAPQVEMLRQVAGVGKPSVFVVSNPYVAAELPFADIIIASYGTNRFSVEAAVDVIFGELEPKGTLPVQVPESIDPSGVRIIAHD